ncbi:MAG TPA: hypothetical protein VFX59_11550 [Polyangiales bacterium]|nr:hypothetical protein [Polyangiales bacterium]
MKKNWERWLTAVLAVASLGMAGTLAYDKLTCCEPGAACCAPGAPCCAAGHSHKD